MASITEYLKKLQELTQTNLSLLESLNDALFTDKNHLTVNLLGTNYNIPSFISLENKLNLLTENFENLVHAPERGEAHFHINGNTRTISVNPYTHAPNSIMLDNVSTFQVSNNDIFKDFLTPNTYININLDTLPNSITSVLVRKVIPINKDLKKLFEDNLKLDVEKDGKIISQQIPSTNFMYKDLHMILDNYKEDVDYISYDFETNLPYKKHVGSGVYVIGEVIKDEVDENLDNFITLKLRNDDDIDSSKYMKTLTYRLFEETIEKNLVPGSILTTYDGMAKMEVVSLNSSSNQLTVKVLNGEYLNLVGTPTGTNISDLSKIKYFSTFENTEKYIKIPLEEDKYIFVCVAPLNKTMNIQASWGTGLMLNTHILTNGEDTFEKFYNNNVKNVGDILLEMTSLLTNENSITKYTKDELDEYINKKPILKKTDLIVTQINKHLDKIDSIKNIRRIYSEKEKLKLDLENVRNEISSITTQISKLNIDNNSAERNTLLEQKTLKLNEENELVANISSKIKEINIQATDSESPLENAKYRIRGFYPLNEPLIDKHIKGIKVQYRYKTVSYEQGTAESMQGTYIFSDWNDMKYVERIKTVEYNEYGKLIPKLEDDNSSLNLPSFNQIDIPISQGETVDVRLKLVYDFGHPFVEVSSKWSDIINIKFPKEFNNNKLILDILKENGKDAEDNRFKEIIRNEGITAHINDKELDQSITYFHKPESISSGFFTPERRIIPLKDKLVELNNSVSELYDEVMGTSGDDLEVTISSGLDSVKVIPYQVNNMVLEPYQKFLMRQGDIEDNKPIAYIGNYVFDTGYKTVSVLLNISLKNTHPNKTIRAYSMFPGSRETTINNLKYTRFDKTQYSGGETKKSQGVYIKYNTVHGNHFGSLENRWGDKTYSVGESTLQRGNQIITFRINNPYDNQEYYAEGDQSKSELLSLDKSYISVDDWFYENSGLKNVSSGSVDGLIKEGLEKLHTQNRMWVYPLIKNEYDLSLPSNLVNEHIVIKPGEEIIIPVVCEYYMKNDVQNKGGKMNKTISFDLRTSLYNDPINYTIKLSANYWGDIFNTTTKFNSSDFQWISPGQYKL